MQGVGPGSLLGGRYLVERRVSVHPRFERWTASDQALERAVVVLCFPTESPTASAAVDSARRAAGIEEPRLVRVLDVGESDGVSFVVEEPLTGARSLTTLVANGGMPSEEARRLVGEAASALESARIRGVHHGALGPRSVLLLTDGAVKVRGLATEAALLGIDDAESRTALRTDAVALVALTYAALTGRWPLSANAADPGLPAAPTIGSGVAAPAELASGVPADLDTLARSTLNDDQGPRSPGDLAAQIAPWSPTPYAAVLARPSLTPSRRAVPAGSSAGEGASAGSAAATTGNTAPGAIAASPKPSRWARAARAATVLGLPVAGDAPAPSAPETPVVESAAAETPVVERAPAEARELERTAPEPVSASATTPEARRSPASDVPGELANDEDDEDGEDVGYDLDDQADGEFEDYEGYEGYADDDTASAGGRSLTGDTGSMRIVHDMRLSDTLEDDDDPEPPVPLGSGGGALRGDQSRVALIVVAVLVVVAAVIGVANLTRGHSPATQAAPTTPAVVTPTASASAPATAPVTATATAAPSSDIAITNAQAWDPEGDQQEGNASAPRAYDGDPTTMWRSQAYQNADFGGFAKSGIGLVLDLGQETQVHRVVATLRGGADVTVYLANRLSLDGAVSIGSSSGKDGDVTLSAPGGTAKGTLVILWFTKLAPDGEGSFRAQVAEVKVS